MINFSNYRFEELFSRPISITFHELIMKRWCGEGLKMWICIYEDFPQGTMILDKPSWDHMQKKAYDRIFSKQEEHLKSYEEKKKNLLNTSKALASFSEEEKLIELYNLYCNAYSEFIDYVLGAILMNKFLEDEIRKRFPKQFNMITRPYKPSRYQRMEKALMTKPLEKVTSKYASLNIYSGFEEVHHEHFFRTLKPQLNQAKINNNFEEFEKNKKEFGEFIKTVKDKHWKDKCILMHEYAWIKNDRIDAIRKAIYFMTIFFSKLAKKVSHPEITGKTLVNATSEEIRNLIRGKSNIEELKKRNKEILFYYDKEIHIITDKKEIVAIKKKLLNEEKKQDFLKGTIASKGNVKGRAIIIRSIKDISRVRKGDILIANATDPRFTPAMEKAAAIVTDEGNILSHAAIISRELSIPCVIGTKIATKVFKDGDMVEVDANKGIIKKL